jgi:vitamin B12 transport system permease protein
MNPRSLLIALFSLLTAAMLGLAIGAAWMLPVMLLQRPLPELAPLIGGLLGIAVRSWVRPAGLVAAVLAGGATLLAAVYVSVLLAAARIAGSMGIGLVEALREAGLAMSLQLARLSLSPGDLGWFGAGTAIAMWAAGRSARRGHR